jgi:lipoprotein-anchoring transpeptidase ErfK/SrfK
MLRIIQAGLLVALMLVISQAPAAVAQTYKFNFSSQGWQLNPKFKRTEVSFKTDEKPGTIIIRTSQKFLFLVLPNGKALRYGIGVGRDGFRWSGVEYVTRKAEWPSWTPPPEMRKREPHLPAFMKGGPDNPLGARALYLGSTIYRIHGTAQPWTIGTNVSSGCIRLQNEDVIHLYERVKVGAKVIVE